MNPDRSETILDDSELVIDGSPTGPPSSEGDHQSYATCPSESIHNHTQRACEELVSTAMDLHHPAFTPFEHQVNLRKLSVTQIFRPSQHKTSSHHSDSTPTEGNLSATRTAHLAFSSQNTSSQDPLTSTCFQTIYGTNCTNSYQNKPQELFGEQSAQCPTTCGITEFGVKVHRESSEIFGGELKQEELPLNFSKCWKW
ncbi:hypothetical protein CROQUDRAFT_96864 [Cronartium quercuum f. sp. fusiforme G11]|uniref:Uncharacterized protein n=1 Tax=Cronartium quercuum f. sp. fusiforme G11 TaxID=708437 RepID=A0A9P6NFE5_9BASI|nr:hypothetical protein CROQUDRAFT_96864 [Cronartium quercuum f. sp. fusiforme G11]